MKIARTLKAGIAVCVVFYSGFAIAIGEDIAKHAITEAAGVAKAAINQNKQEVTVQNSTLDNKVKIDDSIAIQSNLGIKASGDIVKINNSTLKNDVKVTKSILYKSNAGIELGNGR